MELKPGYKQTEVGVIPDDWEIALLQEVAILYNGRAFSIHEWERKGTPVIRLQNLTGGNEYYYSTLKLPDDKYCDFGDLLYMWSATFGPKFWFGEKAIYHYHIWKVLPVEQKASKNYLFYKLLEITEEKKARASNGGTMLHVTKEGMEKTNIVLPPLKEQTAIASALSDVDALIESLDRLIAKKRDIKQAAMQELLTGKTRLPGFSDKWEEKELKELGSFLKGKGVKKEEALSGPLPCIRYGELYTRHNDIIRAFYSWISTEVAGDATKLKQGDILFAGSGETKEEIGKCAAFINDIEAYAGGDIVILRPLGVDSIFMGYYCNTTFVTAQKSSKGQGDAVVHISAKSLSEIYILLPPLKEQTAIASVLSDMDAEIEALEKRRAKTADLKQGMMQELLTGRTRLVQPEIPHV